MQAVARYINENREVVLEFTAIEIAAATQTSDATVVRAIQALGFAGLRDLKQTIEHWFGHWRDLRREDDHHGEYALLRC